MYVKKLPEAKERTSQKGQRNPYLEPHFDVKKLKLTYLRIRDHEKRDPAQSQHRPPDM